MRYLWSSVALLGALLSGCSNVESHAPATRYVTQYGLGPDKWATAWLLTHYQKPNAQLIVTASGQPLAEGISFDQPVSAIRRIGNRSAFEVARAKRAIDDPVLVKLAQIVNDIEVNYWGSGLAEADHVEEAFRSLQRRYGRDAVPPECYVGFFDRVYQVLKDSRDNTLELDPARLHLTCNELTQLAGSDDALVRESPIVDVLSAMAAGRRVVFVDVRESDEFVEAHIPGALNIPLRDVRPELRAQFEGAAYVVSYCVKDFRGFEMAKSLARIGVSNSVILQPYGIKGWVSLGLPVVGEKGSDELEAETALRRCLRDVYVCVGAKT